MNKINIAEFDVKCSDIAKALGGVYVPQPDCWVPRGEIILSGAAITVAGVAHNGKVEVSGVWPSNKKNEQFFPRSYDKSPYSRITCSLSRDAKAIANDIQRRFLPAFLTELGVQKARCASSDDYAARTEANVANFVRISEGKRYEHRPNEVSLSGIRSDIWGCVKVSGDSVAMELSALSPAQAEAVLKLFVTL